MHEDGDGMNTFLHSYIKTLLYTGAICFSAILISPDGSTKKAVWLACAIAMAIAVVYPVTDINFEQYSKVIAEYRTAADKITNNAKEDSENLNRLYIQEQCAAYILDKADKMGIALTKVNVLAQWADEGYWYPVSADIACRCTQNEINTLSGIIESELGISKDSQNWCNENG